MFTMRTTPNKSEAEPAPSKPANAKPPDIASASVPDTLAALHVNPDSGLTHAEVDVRRFWATMPSKTLVAALMADALTGTALTFVGLPGLTPLPGWQALAIFVYAMISCLVVNDAVKVTMIKWRVPAAVA
jgi:hypothetical protein